MNDGYLKFLIILCQTVSRQHFSCRLTRLIPKCAVCGAKSLLTLIMLIGKPIFTQIKTTTQQSINEYALYF